MNFLVTNNETEYKAFIAGLGFASKLKAFELHIFSDSKPVVNQVSRKFKARGAKIVKYLVVAKNPLTKFKAIRSNKCGGT